MMIVGYYGQQQQQQMMMMMSATGFVSTRTTVTTFLFIFYKASERERERWAMQYMNSCKPAKEMTITTRTTNLGKEAAESGMEEEG